ncbi:MAG: reverse transcriptase domain-containing protein, partial [Candidatus Pacebacteria bacterium]|nr:reverse transcriptase domain-containing protein [Candidatus Paceibacterota bacterium]
MGKGRRVCFGEVATAAGYSGLEQLHGELLSEDTTHSFDSGESNRRLRDGGVDYRFSALEDGGGEDVRSDATISSEIASVPVAAAAAAPSSRSLRTRGVGVPPAHPPRDGGIIAGPGVTAAPAAPSPISTPAPSTSSTATRSSSRHRTRAEPHNVTAFVANEDDKAAAVAAAAVPLPDPTSYAEAMASPEAPGWMKAMDIEMAAHVKNGTWIVVEAPPHRRPVANKWVYKTKYRADGTKEKLKARLCAKGFTQEYGVDYLNTYSPAVRYKTLRLVLVLATRWDFELSQLDVETAFLNARMKEEVYMELPAGYEQQLIEEARRSAGVRSDSAGSSSSSSSSSSSPRFVCRLVMCLYGTKQASMEWNRTVNATIVTDLGFTRTVCDPCLYFKISYTGLLMLLCLFVDDIVVAYHARDETEWLALKA